MKPLTFPEFFRLLYAIAEIAFITARIIASLDFSLSCKWIFSCHFKIKTEIKTIHFASCHNLEPKLLTFELFHEQNTDEGIIYWSPFINMVH